MEWISVKESSMDEDGRFLVYEQNVGVYIAFVTKQNGDYFWSASSLTARNNVTHWMPLPKGPDCFERNNT